MTLLKSSDGTLIEIFEWAPGGAEKAHDNPEVMKVWGEFANCCDIVTLKDLPEHGERFPHFAPVDGVTK